jgi:ABC-type amino acid transport substrate-binding protein
VKQGQADATMDTSGPLSYAVAKDSNLKLAVGVKVGVVEDFALGVKKGEPELLKRLGEFMKEFHAKKEGTALFLKWFGIPPSSIVFEGLE